MHLNLSCPAVSQLGGRWEEHRYVPGRVVLGAEVGNRRWEKQGAEGVGKRTHSCRLNGTPNTSNRLHLKVHSNGGLVVLIKGVFAEPEGHQMLWS